MSINVFWKRLFGVIFILAGVAALAFTSIALLKWLGFLALAGGLITIVFSRD